MRVVVKPEDHQVVVLDEALLGLIDRVLLEVCRLIHVVVERRLVCDDEVPAGRRGPAKDVERRHTGGGDRVDLRFRRAGLERIHGLRPPGDSEFLQLLLNACDDLLGSHALTLQ